MQASGEPNAAVTLASAARRRLESIPEAAPFLADWPPPTADRDAMPGSLPVCRWLPGIAAFAAPATAGLASLVAEAAARLEWRQTYSAADFGADFLARYGWTELIGLRGPIASERVACGLLLLAPDTDYPAHAHEAEELYLPLAGAALWRKGEADFVLRNPGEPIAHRPWEAHAVRTRGEPLLSLYVWRGGDLQAKSKIIARS